MGARNINSVFYAQSYHPIQAGSIDGTDICPHDNAVYRALLCSSAGLYDPFGDPKVIGDPYCTLFVGRLSHRTDEESLRKAMSKYGRVKNLRLVRHIVTGASRGYAFVEYETDREMRRAYEDAHHSLIDDTEVIVDYNRQQLMPEWIPRRLGGGLGGKKESGQLRFGGRERPFRAPLRIPYDELKRLGIPPPPEGRYMSRFQVPSPPRRSSSIREGSPSQHQRSEDREEHSRWRSSIREGSPSRHQRSEDREEHSRRRSSHREDSSRRSKDREKPSTQSSSHISREDSPPRHRRSKDREEPSSWRSSHVSSGDLLSRQRRHEDAEEPSRRRNSHIIKEDSLSRHRRSEEREEPRRRRRRSPSDVDESSHKHYRRHSEHSLQR